VAALSDCTSHILSNWRTRAPGWTNHWMIWHSLVPGARQSQRPINRSRTTLANIREYERLDGLQPPGTVE
jgi:hypothetical protein